MNENEQNGMTGIIFDYGRIARIGLPEAVFCEKKSVRTLRQLMERFASGNPPILFTRLHEAIFQSFPEELRSAYDYDPLSRTAYAAKMPRTGNARVAIVSAGAADASVAAESARTLEYLGIGHTKFEDCGISALWRLTERLEAINAHQAVIVIAGMEGALASVVGGLCGRPIFAVPTSVGYGVGGGGRAALDSMLSSCAPGIGVLNIDNGYGAACAVARVINQA